MRELESKKEAGIYIWNTVAGLVNASEAVVLSMVITRTNGLADAGVLSIAFAVGNLMMTIGKFGVRNFQVTDVNHIFSFSDYFWARIISVLMMVIASGGYLYYCMLTKDYSLNKMTIVFLMCLIYAVESMEEVFWGMYQQKGALDVGARNFTFRWGLILAGFSLVLIVFHDLLTASVAGVVIAAAAFLFFTGKSFTKYKENIGKPAWANVRQVFRQCFPLFIVAFMAFYVTNAPKYAIDKYMNEEIQACYGFIAMPVFVIELLNGFIYQPVLVQIAMEWNEGKITAFRKRVRKQCLIILCLTLICLAGAYLLGIPVLSLIYGTDLSGYKNELLILLVGGGGLAFVGFFCVLMTVMRKQINIMWGYTAIAILAASVTGFFVKEYGVIGATLIYTFLMFILAVIFGVMYLIECRRNGRNK